MSAGVSTAGAIGGRPRSDRAKADPRAAQAERPWLRLATFTALAGYGLVRWATLMRPEPGWRLIGLLALAVVMAGAVPVIGRYTRLYFAFITTAPADLDSPATITLHAGNLSEVSGFAAEPLTLDPGRASSAARLVLVDAMELAWQRAQCRGNQHLLLPADPVLVGLNTLQHWLWQRLQAPAASQVAA